MAAEAMDPFTRLDFSERHRYKLYKTINQPKKRGENMVAVKNVTTSIPGYRPVLEERETIITFDETKAPAVVYTFNPALIRKLDALAEERADEVSVIRAESINGVELREYQVPKKWIKVNASRVLSEEERAAYVERGKIAALNFKK